VSYDVVALEQLLCPAACPVRRRVEALEVLADDLVTGVAPDVLGAGVPRRDDSVRGQQKSRIVNYIRNYLAERFRAFSRSSSRAGAWCPGVCSTCPVHSSADRP
jgi:hypothetical protein